MENDTPAIWSEGHEDEFRQINEAIAADTLRTDISCDEARREWFTIARNMQAESHISTRPVTDFEVGLHLGGCVTTACQFLVDAYPAVTAYSRPEDSVALAALIERLEARVAELGSTRS